MLKAKTAANAILQYESGQSFVPMAALTNSGDELTYTSPDSFWSGTDGKEPVVYPDGLASGGVITPHADNNKVSIAALTCYLAGELKTVNAGTLTATRGADANTHRITSLTINDSGVLTAIAGTAHTAFSDTRGADGGAPYIPVGSIEIGQVKFTATSAAAVAVSEIFQVDGTHRELWNHPLWDESWTNGEITFLSALPTTHTGDTTKKVYAEYYTPIFAEVPNASDFVAPENTHSQASETVYGGTIGSSSASLGQGSFKSRLQSGVSDGLLSVQDKICWFKFFPDRLKTEYVAAQGKLGIKRSFPAGSNILADCTISATEKAENISA
jgi:hypothetical protein